MTDFINKTGARGEGVLYYSAVFWFYEEPENSFDNRPPVRTQVASDTESVTESSVLSK